MTPFNALEQGAPSWVEKWYIKYQVTNPNWKTEVKQLNGMWYVSTVMPV
jgi:hypothetical protein